MPLSATIIRPSRLGQDEAVVPSLRVELSVSFGIIVGRDGVQVYAVVMYD